MRIAVAILCIGLTPVASGAASREDSDAHAIAIYRAGLATTVNQMRHAAHGEKQLLSGADKDTVRRTWAGFLDYVLALDSIDAHYRPQKTAASVALSYAAFLAEYRRALEMIAVTDRLPGIDAVLNEAAASAGLPTGSYAQFKLRFLNVARASEFAALESLYRLKGKPGPPQVAQFIAEDAAAVIASGGKGVAQTAANAAKIGSSSAFTAWFPVQKGVAEWMGDTRVAGGHEFLINTRQITALATRLQPGDVFLERREWFVSNVGLPGYWPHTALYIGSGPERSHYFDDPSVREWLQSQGRADGDFEAFLRERNPALYAQSQNAKIIEAMSEGVLFTTLTHSASADSLAVVRPRVSKREKAIAVARAFGYIGLPYDFNFDFHTDNSLVCSEVIYKAYEGSVTLPLVTMVDRVNTPPNEIVRAFDEAYGTPRQQLDFVLFLDGNERKHAAVEATLADFRSSWRRPKWHTFTH